MYIYSLSVGHGPRRGVQDIVNLHLFTTREQADKKLLEYIKTQKQYGKDSHITTKGEGYYTIKYHWPIKDAELRRTYFVQMLYVEEPKTEKVA